MPGEQANEAYLKLLALVENQTTLLGILGENYGAGVAMDQGGFPKLSWRRISGDQNSELDVQRCEYHVDTIQFDLYGTDEDQLWHLASLVDQMNDAPLGSDSLDSANYRCKELRRLAAWQTIHWGKGNKDYAQRADGNELVQLTSDWRFSYLLKQ